MELMPQSRAKLDANLKDFEAQLASTETQVGNELAPLKGKGYFVFTMLTAISKNSSD